MALDRATDGAGLSVCRYRLPDARDMEGPRTANCPHCNPAGARKQGAAAALLRPRFWPWPDAERVLLARLDDADLRAWVSNHIRKDCINRLSIYAREGIPEEAIIAAWRADLYVERDAKAEAADDARTKDHVLRALAEMANRDAPVAGTPHKTSR